MAGFTGQAVVMPCKLEINMRMIESSGALTLPSQIADEGKILTMMFRVTLLTDAGSVKEKISVIALDLIDLFGDFTVALETTVCQSLIGVALTT